MKNNRWIYGILLISLIFTIYSCAFYKTVSIQEVSETTLVALAKQKQFITIQTAGISEIFILENHVLENGVLSGTLKRSSESDHPGDKRIFSRSNGKQAKSYLHLHTASSLEAGPFEIPIAKISGMESHENEYVTSLLATTGVIATGVVVAAVAFVAIACSCPHVATINPDGISEFQGSLFPGSIFKSLKRTDFLTLKNVIPDEDELITLQVFNDLDEVQYIDQVELLAVQHTQSNLGLIENNKLVAYNVGNLPIKAVSQIDRNVLEQVSGRDNSNYNFDDPAIEGTLNTLELSFKTSELGSDALLVIYGQQTELLDHTAEVFFQQFGSAFPSWVDKMNKKDPSNYNQNSIDQGISLNAYIKNNEQWDYVGNYENVGAMAKRGLAIPIDLSESGSEIIVKLETAYGFWSLDQITLTSDWDAEVEIKSLELISAVNQDNKDVLHSLEKIDEEYLVQTLKGTSTNLKFKASSENSTYVLSGTGYYNHARSYANTPNYKFLKKMKRTKHSTHELAQMVQLYEDMHVASNN